MASQNSFATVLERFSNGNTLIQAWTDYNPGNADITKTALTAFIIALVAGNKAVTDTEKDLGDEREIRNPLVFKIKDENPDCMEICIRGMISYQDSDKDNKEFKTASKKLKKILKQIRPKYKKKDPAAPRGAGKSPMEKSFASAVGQGRAVIAIITKLGVDYSPPDPKLSVVNFTALVDKIEQGNKDVQTAEEANSTAINNRKELYKGAKGLEKRRSAILNYLGSFPKLKKSDHYIAYNNAIKGN